MGNGLQDYIPANRFEAIVIERLGIIGDRLDDVDELLEKYDKRFGNHHTRLTVIETKLKISREQEEGRFKVWIKRSAAFAILLAAFKILDILGDWILRGLEL